MRDLKRIEPILSRIRALWLTHPDLRLGQLIGNAIFDEDLYYLEDDEFVEALEKQYQSQAGTDPA